MAAGAIASLAKTGPDWRVPILVYHRFGPVVADAMTVRTASFDNQLSEIRKRDLRVTPLQDLLRNPTTGAMAITADDGHRSVYSEMWPRIEAARLPITLFLYPSAISNAGYALTWAQIREMLHSGLVGIGSHTFWHPNFLHEKKRLSPDAWRQFVQFQLVHSKQVLEQKLSVPVTFLAWPFGLYDDDLIHAAQDAGYKAAFTIQRRLATPSDSPMALPRFLMTDLDVGTRFERLICP